MDILQESKPPKRIIEDAIFNLRSTFHFSPPEVIHKVRYIHPSSYYGVHISWTQLSTPTKNVKANFADLNLARSRGFALYPASKARGICRLLSRRRGGAGEGWLLNNAG